VDALPEIPIPPHRRWAEARHRLGPVVVFGLVVAAVAYLWLSRLRPTTFVGQVEVVQASVISPDTGLLTNLWVLPLQEVKAGDLVAEVFTTDPRTVNNRLEVMRDRMRLTELELTPILIRQRTAIDYERLNVEAAMVRAELATARVNLMQASNEFLRISNLYSRPDRIVSDTDYDLAKARFEGLQMEVAEKSRIVAETERSLERLASMADAFVPSGDNDPVRQALALEEAKIRVFEDKLKPLQLLAPIDGVVTCIHHRPGEQIIAGTVLVTITAKTSDRIVAFLPRNLAYTPKVGTPVEVSTRSTLQRRTALATVIGIGPQLEGVTNPLIMPPVAVNPYFVPNTGRPISISLPPELKLLPGELVDIRLLPEPRASVVANGSGTLRSGR
jgi:multidrug resistance efflux pump